MDSNEQSWRYYLLSLMVDRLMLLFWFVLRTTAATSFLHPPRSLLTLQNTQLPQAYVSGENLI